MSLHVPALVLRTVTIRHAPLSTSRVCKSFHNIPSTLPLASNRLMQYYLMATFALFFVSPTAHSQEAVRAETSLDSLLQMRISTAAKYWQTPSQAAASVSIITASDIERFGFRTLQDVFTALRGFYVSYDRNYTYVGVRGFSRPTDFNNRILLLLNGHTLNENVYGSSPLGTDFALDLGLIERIEIVRGPGSALYGTSAMFAVMNVITKTGRDVDGLRAAFRAGSLGWRQAGVMYGREFHNGLDLVVGGQLVDVKGADLYYAEFDAPETHRGIARALDWERYYGVFVRAAYKRLTVQSIVASREKGIPTASYGTRFNQQSYSVDQRRLVELKFDSPFAHNKSLLVRASYNFYHYGGRYPYAEYLNEDASDGVWLGAEAHFQWDIAPRHRFIAGVEHQLHPTSDYRNMVNRQTQFYRNVSFSSGSVFAQHEYLPSPLLSVTVGMRYDHYSTFGGSLNPRAAIILYPTRGSTLKALYGTAFRAPNFYEVYYEDPTFRSKGNPSLKPETITTAELVWEQRLGEFFFGSASVYRNRMKDMINQTLDDADSLTRFRNVSRVNAQGVELEVQARVPGVLHGKVSYSASAATDADTEQRLTNSPAHTVTLHAAVPLPLGFEAGLEALYETERRTVFGTFTVPYHLINLTLATGSLLRNGRLSLSIRNLLNTTYSLPGGLEHVQHSIAQDGRTVLVSFRYAIP